MGSGYLILTLNESVWLANKATVSMTLGKETQLEMVIVLWPFSTKAWGRAEKSYLLNYVRFHWTTSIKCYAIYCLSKTKIINWLPMKKLVGIICIFFSSKYGSMNNLWRFQHTPVKGSEVQTQWYLVISTLKFFRKYIINITSGLLHDKNNVWKFHHNICAHVLEKIFC